VPAIATRLGHQGLGGAHLELHLAERLQHQGIVGVALDLRVRVGAALGGHESGRLGDRGAGDAGVDGGVQELRERAVRLSGALPRR